MSQKNNVSHYEHLKDKWNQRNSLLQKSLWKKHKEALEWAKNRAKHFAVGSLSGLLLLSPSKLPVFSLANVFASGKQPEIQELDKNVFLVADLSHILPDKIRPLTFSEEDVVSQTLTRHFGFPVTSELGGKRLNRSFGYIGAEQHLTRYPGDSIFSHFDNEEDAKRFASSGMAPGKGAWGYFANARNELSEKDKLREKYYIAVQTFLVPDYNLRVAEYRDFFKFRKMLVVNPQNGKAIIAVIGDSGPADWTGKHLGGSPEVMSYLEREDGAKKGQVLYFFIDDPGDAVPLGPVAVQ